VTDIRGARRAVRVECAAQLVVRHADTGAATFLDRIRRGGPRVRSREVIHDGVWAAIPVLILLAAAALLVAGFGTLSSGSLPRALTIGGPGVETATAAVRVMCPETDRLTEIRAGAAGAAGVSFDGAELPPL
jgi:hypothetical protein